MPENPAPLPDFTRWPSFPFEGDLRVKQLNPPVAVEPARSGEDAADCVACNTPDEAYIWVSERWRVRAMDRPTGLPMVLILECRSHLDLGDLPNLLAAELGVMTVRLERAIRSLDGVARVHVNRWGDGSAHLHMWFLARPYGQLQLRGTFLSLWDDILPRIPEQQWRENLALVAAWLAEFGGRAIAEPPHIQWEAPATFAVPATAGAEVDAGVGSVGSGAFAGAGDGEGSPRGWDISGSSAGGDGAGVEPGAGEVHQAGEPVDDSGSGGASEGLAGNALGDAGSGTAGGLRGVAGDGAAGGGVGTDTNRSEGVEGTGHRSAEDGADEEVGRPRVPRQADGSRPVEEPPTRQADGAAL